MCAKINEYGFLVIFYMLDEDNNPYKNIVYLDQSLSETNKQDCATVVVLIKISKCTIIHELPFVKVAVLTPDNATSYQNQLLTFMMAIFNQKLVFNIDLCSYRNTRREVPVGCTHCFQQLASPQLYENLIR